MSPSQWYSDHTSLVSVNKFGGAVQEYDSDWAKRIQLEKFRWHNSQWIEMVESQQQDDEDDDLYDDLPPYLHDDGLLLYEPSECDVLETL